jgi:HD-GYP domain-containing protein (c-di-GMP phosphodiesterase class II)
MSTRSKDQGLRVMRIRAIVLRLAGVIRTSRIHTTKNRALSEAIEDLVARLVPVVNELGELLIRIDGAMLRVNGTIVAELKSGAMVELRALARDFADRGVGGLHLLSAPTAEQLTAFLGLWRSRTHLPEDQGADLLTQGLESLGVGSIVVLPPRVEPDFHPTDGAAGHSHADVLGSYTALLAVGELLERSATATDPETTRRADAAVNRAGDVVAAAPELAMLVATHRDPNHYTPVHAANTCMLSMLVARRLGLGLEGILDVGRGALLADVGMGTTAPETRSQAGELGREATAAVLDHPLRGFAIALGQENLGARERAQLVVAWEHHCGIDGDGYPAAAPGGTPHLYARIVSMCDAYDALVHDRADRAGLARPLALEALYQEAGSRFDRTLLHVLYGMLGRFPPGSVVRLREGHVGLVLAPAEDVRLFDRPLLLITRGPGGRVLDEPVELDLAAQHGERASRVTHVLDERRFPERVIPLVFA